MKKPSIEIKTPLIVSFILIVGMFAGHKFNLNLLPKSDHLDGSIYNEIIGLVKENYVDEPNIKKINKDAIEQMLRALDPHSDYIPSTEVKSSNSELEGNFEGIGIEFNIINDTIVIISALSGGPAEKVGLSTGDKIIKVDSKTVSGVKITTEELTQKMRGEKGTELVLEISHPNETQLRKIQLKRDVIGVNSIDLSYLPSADVGYIKISRFGSKTKSEFNSALKELKVKGLKSLILDLRGNPGGYLSAAVSIADEFLDSGKAIMYTLGKHKSKEEFIATDIGEFQKGNLIILIDEGSASASEIVAGAIQDQDRGILVGRRSFGKGLVQEPYVLSDGSELRLTVARYYIPSGRCIQRDYSKGKDKYFEEAENRFLGKDTSNQEYPNSGMIYHTKKGKKVFGGGGVSADIFVQKDSIFRKKSLQKVFLFDAISNFSLAYSIKNKKEILKSYPNESSYISNFEIPSSAILSFINILVKKGINPNDIDSQTEIFLQSKIKAQVGRNLFGFQTLLKIENEQDKVFQKGLEILKKNLNI